MIDFLTPIGTAISALLGGLTSGSQWRTADGKLSLHMIAVNCATAIILAEVVGGLCDVGDHYGYAISVKIQLALSAIAGYMGPALIIKPIYDFLAKRFGGLTHAS